MNPFIKALLARTLIVVIGLFIAVTCLTLVATFVISLWVFITELIAGGME